MKTENNQENTISKEAEKEGKQETANREQEVERTGGNRGEHESPMQDADQHRGKDHTSKPQQDEHDSM